VGHLTAVHDAMLPLARTWTISSVYLKLWNGHYSLGTAFWGFFVVGYALPSVSVGWQQRCCCSCCPQLPHVAARTDSNCGEPKYQPIRTWVGIV
jgi:hypothetical protein